MTTALLHRWHNPRDARAAAGYPVPAAMGRLVGLLVVWLAEQYVAVRPTLLPVCVPQADACQGCTAQACALGTAATNVYLRCRAATERRVVMSLDGN